LSLDLKGKEEKAMKKLYALLTVLILFMGICSSAFAKTKTQHNYPELVCDHGNMDYTIARGDTLSEIAQHYGQTMAAIVSVKANKIVRLDRRIYAGRKMIIPCPTSRCANRCPRTKNAKAAVKVTQNIKRPFVKQYEVASNAPSIISIKTSDDQFVPLAATAMSGDWSANLLTLVQEASAMTTVLAAAATTQTEQAPTLPSLSRSSTMPTKKVKGFQLVLTADEAKPYGVVLNRNMDTRILLYNSEEDKMRGFMNGERHNLKFRARRRGNNIVFNVSLSKLPHQPFLILVNGLKQPIDGDYFVLNCQPLQGRFPEAYLFTRVMFTGSKMLLNTGLITVMSGGNLPLGITAGVALPIVR
jgi:LysM repeat protein